MHYAKNLKLTAVAIALSLSSISSVQAALTWSNWNGSLTDSASGHAKGKETEENFGTVKDNVNSVANDLDSTKTSLANTQQDVAVNKTKIDANAKNIDKNTDSINKNTLDITKNSTDISNNRAFQDTVNNQQAIYNSNQRLINTQQAKTNDFFERRLDGLDQDVVNLNQRVDTLRDKMNRGLAAQSALSGLFQPYSVGHFNTSMSFGGYESDTALALGAGYRLNEHVAFKAGLATNTDDFKGTAYNAAVNFEW